MYQPITVALAKTKKPKPKPKPTPQAPGGKGGDLDWVRVGAAVRGGLVQPTQWGGKK